MISWPQNTYVGQKVVCVGPPAFKPMFGPIVKIGNVYTIKNINISPKTKTLHFELEEIFDIHYPSMNWEAIKFRPVQSTEKGMSILKEILLTQKVREDA